MYTEYSKGNEYYPVRLHLGGIDYGLTIAEALELTRMLTETLKTAIEQGAKL